MSRTGFHTRRRSLLLRCLVGAIVASMPIAGHRVSAAPPGGSTIGVDVRLKRSLLDAGDNRPELERALARAAARRGAAGGARKVERHDLR